MRLLLTCISSLIILSSFGQSFTKITVAPIGTDTPSGGYAGASWIDYDGDNDLDLFVNSDFLYQNDGTGVFTRVMDSGLIGGSSGLNNGNSWADIDNDGDLDVILVNQTTNSGVFKNNGDGTFTKITSGDIASNLNAWSAAWADFDNDGWVDLVATHPCGFIGACHTNWLFNNNGDGSFSEVTSGDIVTGEAAYTVGNWADFDDDGDMDLFIGSGEVGFSSQDHIYINQLTETGTADLVLTQTGTLFGDTRDGQNWNLIDYDNDGDLDAFVTNYKQDVPNDFYKNNGNGTFTKLTDADLGVHMVSEVGIWLANTWGDFNNDGWIDVFITADFGSPFGNHLYLNNGDGTFVHHFPGFANLTGSRATINGDYDNDGDLDLFINATQNNVRGLWRNNLGLGNNENWINISLKGTISNHSAIGATARIKANINGQEIWQRRDISSQNAFCGQSSMRLHFGLGDATSIDSLVIEWPLGLVETYTSISSNQFLEYMEGQTTAANHLATEDVVFEVFPNPAYKTTIIHFELKNTEQRIDLKVVNNSGKVLKILSDGITTEGAFKEEIDVSDWTPGTYFIIAEGEYNSVSKRLVVVK